MVILWFSTLQFPRIFFLKTQPAIVFASRSFSAISLFLHKKHNLHCFRKHSPFASSIFYSQFNAKAAFSLSLSFFEYFISLYMFIYNSLRNLFLCLFLLFEVTTYVYLQLFSSFPIFLILSPDSYTEFYYIFPNRDF